MNRVALFILLVFSSQADESRLEPGERSIEHTGGDPVLVKLAPDGEGPWTLTCESYAFQGELALVGTDGTEFGSDRDERIPSRSFLELRNGADSARVEVRSIDGGAGRFLLVLHQRSAEADRLLRESEVAYGGAEYSRARTLATDAVRLAREDNDERLLANALVIESVALQPLGEMEAASAGLGEALAIYEERGDLRKQLVVFGNIASIAHRRGQGDLAHEMREREIEVARELGDRRAEAGALVNMGGLLKSAQLPEEARLSLEQGLEIFIELGDVRREVTARVKLAETLLEMRELEAARDQAEAGVELARSLGAPTELGTALMTLAGVCRDKGDLLKSRELYSEALDIFESVGHIHSRLWALGFYAQVQYFLGEFTLAKEAYERRIELNDETVKQAAYEAWAVLGLGEIEVRVGSLSRAEEWLEAAREEGVRLRDVFLEAKALQSLAQARVTRGEPDEARTMLERARRLHADRGDPLLVANCDLQIANLELIHDNSEGAARALEAARRGYEALGSTRGEALSKVYEARLLRLSSGHAEARRLLTSVLEEAREKADRHVEVLAALNLGRIAHDLGDFPEALMAFQACYDTARNSGNRLDQGRVIHALADLAIHLGDFDEVERLGELGLSLAEELERPDQVLDMLLIQGAAHRNFGRVDQAREVGRRARGLAQRLGKVHQEARSVAALARVESLLGNADEALELQLHRVDLALEKANPIEQAAALSAVAYQLLEIGEFEEAVIMADRAVASLPDRVTDCWLLNPLWTRARAHLSLGNFTQARADLERADVALSNPSLRDLPRGLAATRRSRFAHWGELAQDVVAARLSSSENDEERQAAVEYGFQQAARWKGRALLEGIVEHRIGGRTAEITELRRELRLAMLIRDDLLNRLSDEIASGASSEVVTATRAELEEVEQRRVRLDEELKSSAPKEHTIERIQDVSAERAQLALVGEGRVVIEFARGTDALHAYVLDERGLSHVDLGAWAPIEKGVEEFLAGISEIASMATVAELAERGRALHALLLEPVLAKLESPPEHLTLVPSGGLSRLPFGALVVDAPAEPRRLDELVFVIDRMLVDYAPSIPVACELADLGPRAESGRVLILADPYYASEGPIDGDATERNEPVVSSLLGGAVASRAVPPSLSLERLQGTRDEALELSRFLARLGGGDEAALLDLSANRSGSLEAPLFDLHLGAEASTERLAADLREFSILHIAAHGFVDPERAHRTGIALAYREGDPGYFTIADALDLDLDANLVVLSACETARGHVQAGEGVQSLARGFLHAGARGVVATLWPVSDEATADVMAAFYAEALERGLPVSEALAMARRALRDGSHRRGVALDSGGAPMPQGFRHPYYWAPFIHIGR